MRRNTLIGLVGWIVLCLGTGGCAGGNQRFEANDPDRVSPNEFFQAYDRAMAEPVTSDGAKDASTVDVATMHKTANANQLAENVMRSWDGYRNATIRWDVWLLLMVANRTSGGGSAPTQASDAKDDAVTKSIGAAIDAQRTEFQRATRLRRQRGPSAQIAGLYDVQTNGTCPFSSGSIEVTQRDFVVQGTRGNKVALWGALGSDQIYVVANEQRYATTGVNPATGRPGFKAPDKPSELFAGKIDAKKMTLNGTMHPECAFTLTRK